MGGVDQSPDWRWLMLAGVILAAFLAAVSLYMQRFHGWSFIVLCFVASSLGGVGYLWGRDRVLPSWERLPKVRRLSLIALTAAIVLSARLIANRHNPKEAFADLLVFMGVLVAFALSGLYRILSHLLDSSHARTSRR
jgi:hypothetical protein